MGHHNVVKLIIIVDHGTNINKGTMDGTGEMLLHWSIKENSKDHPMSQMLKKLEAD